MKITSKNQSIHVDKPEGSQVDYYLFPEYEIHYNVIIPGTIQPWHHHEHISETILILNGQIEAHWVDKNGVKNSEVVKTGDVIEVKNSPHTFINSSLENVTFVVFRFVPTGINQQEKIKNDKIIDQITTSTTT